MSNMSIKEQKLLAQAEARAVQELRNKEAARIHLLAMKDLLARTPISRKPYAPG